VYWAKDKWDEKRYLRFAAGSFVLAAMIFLGLVWPYKFSLATDPRLSSDLLPPLIGFGILAAVLMILLWSVWVSEAGIQFDGDTDGRRWRTLAISGALPIALIAWWAVSLRSDHAAQGDMFSAFKAYTPLIKNGDLLGNPSVDSGGASTSTICANGPEITLKKTATDTEFCAVVTRDKGHAQIDSGYTMIQPRLNSAKAVDPNEADFGIGCFASDPRELGLIELVTNNKNCATAVANLPPDLSSRVPYNPTTSVLPGS
jgi:hypothetical protein